MIYIVVQYYYNETRNDSVHTDINKALSRIKYLDRDSFSKDYSHYHAIQFWDLDKKPGKQYCEDYPEIKYWGENKEFMCWFPPRTGDPFCFKDIEEYYKRKNLCLKVAK